MTKFHHILVAVFVLLATCQQLTLGDNSAETADIVQVQDDDAQIQKDESVLDKGLKKLVDDDVETEQKPVREPEPRIPEPRIPEVPRKPEPRVQDLDQSSDDAVESKPKAVIAVQPAADSDSKVESSKDGNEEECDDDEDADEAEIEKAAKLEAKQPNSHFNQVNDKALSKTEKVLAGESLDNDSENVRNIEDLESPKPQRIDPLYFVIPGGILAFVLIATGSIFLLRRQLRKRKSRAAEAAAAMASRKQIYEPVTQNENVA